MGERRYALNIEYRMTCSKSDPMNICSDKKREKGFYWKSASRAENEEQFKLIGVTDTDSIEELQKCVEKVTVPEGCEAIKAFLTVILPGSTGANGCFRRNVEFEYFNDFVN